MRLSNAPGWQSGLNTVAGSPTVTYRRGTEEICSLAAVPVNVTHDDYGEEDVSLTARERDWIVMVANLNRAGHRWTPERGDEIDWLDSFGAKRTFQVLPRAGDRCYRHTDPTELQLRIYTVEALPHSE